MPARSSEALVDVEIAAALARLLDQALDLPAAERLRWVDSLGPDCDHLKPRLRHMLEAEAGPGQTGFLDMLPRLSAPGDDSRSGVDASALSADLHRRDPVTPSRVGERFELFEPLGSGGFGSVFRARDNVRGTEVAAKILDRVDPAALRLFKGEFRTIAGVTHPNLIKLFDLCCVEGLWILTMEVIRGRNFRDHIWPDWSTRPMAGRSRGEYAHGMARVRACLRQLDGALKALHTSGILHRDLKPSNVLIDESGRLVVLDFGVAVHLERDLETRTAMNAGTPAYMAPDRKAAEASDWYSVGVMLFEALTGSLPFHGDALDVMRRKEIEDPPAPATLAPWVPQDLNALCVGLLERDPRRRIAGVTVPSPEIEPGPDPYAGAARGPSFVGRTPELAVLEQAYDRACGGHVCVVHVQGASGIGKSALLDTFLARRRAASAPAVILCGRCHERESVPFKALDGVIDSLARYLDRQEPGTLDAILPTDVSAIRRVFPTLRSLGRHVASGPVEPPEPRALRARAFEALRDLFVRLSQRTPVVMAIDDLQWGDADSASALEMLLRSPLQARLLVVVAYRSDVAGSRPVVECLDGLAQQQVATRRVEVARLGHSDAVQLARTLTLQTEPGWSEGQLDALARESGGHPVLLQELLRDRGRAVLGAHAAGLVPSLHELIGRRVASLPGPQRRLVEMLAVCAKPIAVPLVLDAAGIEAGDLRTVDSLVAARLVRTTIADGTAALETYHDKVRESVTGAMHTGAITDHHSALARVLAASGDATEQLVEHLALAGESGAAARAARTAADRANQALAFARASRLYGLALEQGTWPDTVRNDLEEALARSLANAGQARRAAQQFLVAAGGAERTRALALRRNAGDQFLRAGEIEAGSAVLRSVLADVGARWPTSRRQISFGILAAAGRVWWRRLYRREQPKARPARDVVQKVDALLAPATGLILVDPLLAFYFMLHAMLAAQDAGDPERLAYTRGFAAGYAMRGGRRACRRAEREVAAGIALARSIGSARALAWGKMSSAVLATLRGQWRQTAEDGVEAEAILVESCTGVVGELNLARTMLLQGLSMTGQWKRLRETLAAIVLEGEQRGDLVAVSSLPLLAFSYRCHLTQDEPARALQDIDRQIAQCSYVRPGSISLQQYAALGGTVDVLLYCRRYRDAHEAIARDYSRRSSYVRTTQLLRADLYGRTGLALAVHDAGARERPRLLRQVRTAIGTLERQGEPWSDALGARLRAGLASVVGDRERVIHHLSRAEALFQRTGMEYLQACTGRVLDDLAPTGAQRGHEQASQWFAREGVVRPDSMVAMHVPGSWDRVSD